MSALNNKVADIRSYIDSLAIAFNSIPYDGNNKSFITLGMDELLAKNYQLPFNQNFGMCLQRIDGTLSGKNLSDAKLNSAIGLWFLKFAPKNDFNAQELVVDEAFQIGVSFLARLKNDQEDLHLPGNDQSEAVVSMFDLNTIEFDEVGPIGDHHYGYRFEIKLEKSGSLNYDENLWI